MQASPDRARAGRRVATVLIFAVWLAAFALSLDDVVRRTAYSPLRVAGAQGADDYPRVVGFKAGLAAHPSGLAPGDRLVSVDGRDLRGARWLDWVYAVTRRHGADVRLDVRYERGLGLGRGSHGSFGRCGLSTLRASCRHQGRGHAVAVVLARLGRHRGATGHAGHD